MALFPLSTAAVEKSFRIAALRHGTPAVDPVSKKKLDEVSPAGLESIAAMAQLLQERGFRFTVGITSPTNRTQQTAQAVSETVGQFPIVTEEEIGVANIDVTAFATAQKAAQKNMATAGRTNLIVGDWGQYLIHFQLQHTGVVMTAVANLEKDDDDGLIVGHSPMLESLAMYAPETPCLKEGDAMILRAEKRGAEWRILVEEVISLP